jgi:sodium-dependent dicarboxylate transporter 2/3/5
LVSQIFKIASAFIIFILFILLPPFAGLSPQGQKVIAVVLLAIIHLGIANMSACIALLIPITTTLATSLAMNPIVFGLIVGIVVDAVILYPVQTATNLLAYETGLIGGKDVLKVGFGLLFLTALVILYVALPWWSLLGVPLVFK